MSSDVEKILQVKTVYLLRGRFDAFAVAAAVEAAASLSSRTLARPAVYLR